MPNPDIARRRMLHQQLIGPSTQSPVEVVRRLGAVQSQDYYGAKWAVGQRAGVSDAAVEQAVNDGSILRLHVLRPTWHFVAVEDVRWMIELTGPRVIRGMAARHRELQLDGSVFEHSQRVFQQALAGGKHLTRAEMESALNQAGIATDIPQRFVHIVMQAELQGVLCSGVWQGKQNTYALLEERCLGAETMEREAALAELSRRYFTSHGPATIKDYVWWSGLTVTDTRAGIELCGDALIREEIDGKEYWSPAVPPAPGEADPASPIVHLLPNFDEYVVAYVDRDAIFDPIYADKLHMRGGVLNNVITIDGIVAGGWRREIKKDTVRVFVEPIEPLSDAEQQALETAVQQYGSFLELPAVLIL